MPALGEPHTILEHPHIFLDEIMRQAAESEIIRLSADIRAGKKIKSYHGSEINIIQSKELVSGMYLWADQIICGTNETRKIINNGYRQMKWQENNSGLLLPKYGDKLICLQNDWDMVLEDGSVLVNGLIGQCGEIEIGEDNYNKVYYLNFIPDSYTSENDGKTVFSSLKADFKLITQGEPTITKENYYKFPKDYKLQQFDYGYAITCWKAQGSEWDKVLVIEEGFPYDSETHKQFLYTAVTRAKDKLTLVLKN